MPALTRSACAYDTLARLGVRGMSLLIALVEVDEHDMLPDIVRPALLPRAQQLRQTHDKVLEMDQAILA